VINGKGDQANPRESEGQEVTARSCRSSSNHAAQKYRRKVRGKTIQTIKVKGEKMLTAERKRGRGPREEGPE